MTDPIDLISAGSPGALFSFTGDVSGSNSSRIVSRSGSSRTGDTANTDEPALGTASRRHATSFAIQRAVARLLSCAESVDSIIGEEEVVLRTNGFEQLKSKLHKLWDSRGEHEPEFAEFVNMIQMIFFQTDVGEFSDEQFATVRDVLKSAADAREFDDEVNNDLTTRLVKGGLNVFRELA